MSSRRCIRMHFICLVQKLYTITGRKRSAKLYRKKRTNISTIKNKIKQKSNNNLNNILFICDLFSLDYNNVVLHKLYLLKWYKNSNNYFKLIFNSSTYKILCKRFIIIISKTNNFIQIKMMQLLFILKLKYNDQLFLIPVYIISVLLRL